jgi:simple sugar transport system ATP-binding protein
MNVIETVGLTKNFGTFVANDHIDFSVKEGEIKAIVGENGAGKTTLMSMLYGLLQPTSGKIFIRGQQIHFRSPLDAIHLGLGMVHQHFKLSPSLTIYENIVLGTEINAKIKPFGINISLPIIDIHKEKERIEALINEYGMHLDPDAKVMDISIGAKQQVEILKMLYRDVDILILDEPTAVLTPQEVDTLAISLKQLKERKKTIIISTHKLQEVMDMSDSVTVIRAGRVVGNVATADTNERHLAQMMVGRDVVLDVHNTDNNTSDEVIYEAQDISTINIFGKQVLNNVSFKLHKGEILGVAGVEGNGQSELVHVLTGLMTVTHGKVLLKGNDITNDWPDVIRKYGIAIIPEDRFAEGLCRDMSIEDNCVAGYLFDKDFSTNGILRKASIRSFRDRLIAAYDIRVADQNGNVSQLSGGNAQKIIIAREVERNPVVLIAAQPTRGVDVGSIEFIHNKLLELRSKNTAILLISSDLNEILSLSDRVIVMFRGAVIGEVLKYEMSRELIGLLMAGISTKEAIAR